MQVFALVVLLCAAVQQANGECCIVEEITKVLKEAVVRFTEKEHHQTYAGCVKAFMLGDAKECDSKKFKLPQAKTCELCISHVDMKKTVEKHNVKCHSKMICNAMYSNDIDCDEVCGNLYNDAIKTLDKLQEKFEKGEHEAVDALKKFCDKDPSACEDMSKIPQEIQDKFLEDVAPNFRELIKLVRGTAKSKAMPMCGAINQGVELLFGGGSFGIQASKCMNEVVENLTKFAKSFKGK